jgi:Tfp pilus assembly protein PilN
MRAVNLLPPDLQSGPKGPAPAVPTGVENSGAGAFVVLGVLAFAVLALAAYVLAGNTVKDRKAELAAATAKSAVVTKQVNQLKPYADFESVANARVQTVKDLANSRFDWEQALRDLSRAVPSDVTIASLKGDLGSATAATGGGSIRGAITAPAITVTGCTYTQTKVAELMARLRNIDGVTRVSLAKSDKEATASGADGADRNAPNATGYCGKANVPAFELIVFFEGAASASTAPTPGAATTATAAATPAAGATPSATPAAGATPAPAGSTTTSAPAATPTPAPTTTP